MSSPRALGRLVNGRLDLSSSNLKSSDLSKIPVLRQLTELILDNNRIESFESLQIQPSLRILSATNNPVRYLDGLPSQPVLESVDLSETEVSGNPKFRVLCLATIGDRLTTINGSEVTQRERDIAAVFVEKATDALLLEPEKTRETVDPKVFTVYIQRVRPTFSGFSYNRAVLLDLTKNGPLPVVDAVTKGGLISAIHELKARNARLKDLIREKCNELGVEAPSF